VVSNHVHAAKPSTRPHFFDIQFAPQGTAVSITLDYSKGLIYGDTTPPSNGSGGRIHIYAGSVGSGREIANSYTFPYHAVAVAQCNQNYYVYGASVVNGRTDGTNDPQPVGSYFTYVC